MPSHLEQTMAKQGEGGHDCWSTVVFWTLVNHSSSLSVSSLNPPDRSFISCYPLVVVKLAPTLLSVFTSRLSKARSQSPQPPGSQAAQMGQQQSKKSKKGTKEKDVQQPADIDLQTDETSSSTPQGSLSRATGTSTANGSDANSIANGNPEINVSDPAGSLVQSSDARTPAAPLPSKGTAPQVQPGQGAPSSTSSSSPQPSPKPSTTPLDIPAPVPTILSNSSKSFAPSSGASLGALGDAIGNGARPRLDVDDMIQRLLDVGYTGKVSKSLCLKNAEITAICQAAREVLLSQPTLIELSPPVKIVGDVHGQYSDLIRLFEMCGFPPAANYLFLGDYVDRGKQSLETILLLLCYKIKYPENFFLLRGNHECANVTRGEWHHN